MGVDKAKIGRFKSNPNNPRLIKDSQFEKLLTQISEGQAFMKHNPITVDEDFMILSGNQRYAAAKELGLKELWYTKFTKADAEANNALNKDKGLDPVTYEEQCRILTLLQNTHAGEHDWSVLVDWNQEDLVKWGVIEYDTGYTPNFNPTTENGQVTKEDLEKAKAQAETFTKPETVYKATCPHCGEDFDIMV
jgi:hypothetical protein